MSGHEVPEFIDVYVDHTGRIQPVRGRQCDDTCTPDCGRCKGLSNPQSWVRLVPVAHADQLAQTTRHKADQAVRWATASMLTAFITLGTVLAEIFWR